MNTQRMKFAAKKNENAGSTLQKLPRLSEARGDSTNFSAKDSGVKPGAGRPAPVAQATVATPGDLRVAFATNDLKETVAVQDPTVTANQSAVQVERVARLVTQEAMMVRQSGATSLAVSLKVDPHTELLVHLTNNDGQVQASLRCERGTMAGLSTHWDQLSESLARQNIQLLPLAERVSPRTTANDTFSDTTGSRSFNQPSQNQEQTAREARVTLAPMEETATPSRSRGTTTKTSGARRWESWA